MIKKLAITALAPLGVGVLAAAPMSLVRGRGEWALAATAFALAVVPGLLAVAVGERLVQSSPFGRLLALVAATFIRMAGTFGGAAAVFVAVGLDGRSDRIAFWLWVLFAYLASLAVETALFAGPSVVRRPGGEAAGGAGYGG